MEAVKIAQTSRKKATYVLLFLSERMVINHRDRILPPVSNRGKKFGNQNGELIKGFWNRLSSLFFVTPGQELLTFANDTEIHATSAILLLPPLHEPAAGLPANGTSVRFRVADAGRRSRGSRRRDPRGNRGGCDARGP